jgi:hypothetical protein
MIDQTLHAGTRADLRLRPANDAHVQVYCHVCHGGRHQVEWVF